MFALLYTATFLISWSFSRNPFFASLQGAVISAALFCLVSVFDKKPINSQRRAAFLIMPVQWVQKLVWCP